MATTKEGKVAVVTGAGQGIGAAIAQRLAADGLGVAAVDVRADAAEQVAKEIEAAGGRALALPLDVSDSAAVDAGVARVVAELGGLDVVVNNAGITRPAMLHKMTDAEWQAVLDVNLSGVFYLTRAAARAMIEQGRGGRIVNITSASGLQGTVGQINYSAAKAGVVGITKSAARELARHGILVNAVAPAAATPMNEKIRTDEKFAGKTLAQKNLLARYGEPEEIARYVAFLASEDQTYMTGQVLNVDGGFVL
jgi:3-oxoacyl-[acyl-carrier protein] reductase